MSGHFGFSHFGVSTHDMDATIEFYEKILGFPRVVQSLTRIEGGGRFREVYFDVGQGAFLVFMEARAVPGIPADFDTSINGALGVPRGMYHIAFKVSTMEELEAWRVKLGSSGIEVSAMIDLDHARSIFLFDPNGIQLEFCCQVRPFAERDLQRSSEAAIASS